MSNKTKKEELKVRLLEYQRKVAETEIEILKEEYMDVMTNNHTVRTRLIVFYSSWSQQYKKLTVLFFDIRILLSLQIMGLKKFMCCNTNVTPVTCSTVKLQDGAPIPIDNEKLPAMVFFSLHPFKSVDPVYLLDGTVTLSLRSTGEHPDLLKRGHLDVTAMKDMDDLRIALPGSQVDTPWYLLEFDTSAVKDDFVHLVQGVVSVIVSPTYSNTHSPTHSPTHPLTLPFSL